MTTFEGQAFALLGVNADPALEDLQLMTRNGHTTWRNFWDGRAATGGGKIARRWGIDGFPTLYLIDADGVIREVIDSAPEDGYLEPKIKDLLREVETKGAAS